MADRESLTSHWSAETVARFWSRVAPVEGPDDCALWTGGVNHNGYGRFGLARHLAHRIAWELTHGPIPSGLRVLHHCDVPACMAHLFIGTQADNVADMWSKGRAGDSTPKEAASGDRNGSRTHPERLARGDRSPARLHPERVPRGQEHANAKLTEDSVREIRSSQESDANLALRFGISKCAVWLARTRRRWRHVA